VQDRCECGGNAVDVLVDEHLVVAEVERVIEDGGVQSQRRAGSQQRAIEQERIVDLGGHRAVDAFVLPALVDLRARRVPDEEPHGGAGTSLARE
jgi:hypothetical protein